MSELKQGAIYRQGDPESPDMVPELRPYRDEVEAAMRANDMAALRAIVEKAGLEWLDRPLSEKYRSGNES